MKYIKSLDKFLEAKVGELILPKQKEAFITNWGESLLDVEEVDPTDNIIQGEWKLSEEDKMKVLDAFFGVDLKFVKQLFDNLDVKFKKVVMDSIDINLIRKPKLVNILENFRMDDPTIDDIYIMFEAVFRNLSIGETTSDEFVLKDESGRPILDESGKIQKIKKEPGEPVFTNNLVNLASFMESYARCYSVDFGNFDNEFRYGNIYSIRNKAAEDLSSGAYSVDLDIFRKDLWLSIKHNPQDILNMSVSKFFASCQNLYTGSYRRQVVANVFDPNSIPAFLKFDVPIYMASDGSKISDFLPISRVMIRSIEKFGISDEKTLFLDRVYPDKMNDVVREIVPKYSGNQITTKSNSELKYIFTPSTDLLQEYPYMDRLGIEKGILLKGNVDTFYISPKHDWTKAVIKPGFKIKNLIIESTLIPEDFFRVEIEVGNLKLKNISIQSLDNLKIKTDSLQLDSCEFNMESIKNYDSVKRLLFTSCDCQSLNLNGYENLQELGLIFSLPIDADLEEIIGDKKLKKLIVSTDLLNQKNKIYLDKLKKSGIKIEKIGI